MTPESIKTRPPTMGSLKKRKTKAIGCLEVLGSYIFMMILHAIINILLFLFIHVDTMQIIISP